MTPRYVCVIHTLRAAGGDDIAELKSRKILITVHSLIETVITYRALKFELALKGTLYS